MIFSYLYNYLYIALETSIRRLLNLVDKQYLALQEWDKAHPNWEQNESLSVMRCKILKELLGDNENIEKNMKKVLKDVSKQVPLKPQ